MGDYFDRRRGGHGAAAKVPKLYHIKVKEEG
jgi:hypothetical protein